MSTPLRIGFDMDGVLADFEGAFHAVDARLFGPGSAVSAGDPEKKEEERFERSLRETRRRRDVIWRTIESTPNFWETLQPIEPGAVVRIHELMLRHRWEVFFITQRPRTEGDTAQRQTQRWLVAQGFDLPSVLVIGGSRGAAAGALRLNYHVDDNPQNCLDVVADSRAKPLLVVPDGDDQIVVGARGLGIGTARSISDCLDILDRASVAQNQPRLLARIATMVGWKRS